MKIAAVLILPIIARNFISRNETDGFLNEAKVRNRRQGDWLLMYGNEERSEDILPADILVDILDSLDSLDALDLENLLDLLVLQKEVRDEIV